VLDGELRLTEKELQQWDLLAQFRSKLFELIQPAELHSSFNDPARKLTCLNYLSLFLFGLLNPALKTMRALCSASELERVQREICGQAVCLGSFSEAQHLVDPAHLERVFGQLVRQMQGSVEPEARWVWQEWFARDSSVFAALPRMAWAIYGGGRAGAPNRAVRLHLNLHLFDDIPQRCQITEGRVCERKSWKEQWERGAGYVGDRYFGKDFGLFGRLDKKHCAYVIRLIEEATINVEQELPVSEADRRAGVIRQAWATLGQPEHRSVRLRVVWIEGRESALILVTNLSPEVLPAELVSLLYRKRWQIECFFRWVKCLLGCRHWFAESQRGVTIQLYLALIASLLLQAILGRRPNKRMLELIQLYQLGWATLQELINGIQREQQREATRKKRGP
jgi:hypothetical protein